MKKLLFFVMLFSMARLPYAQCPDNATDDVRVVYASAFLVPGGISLNLCKHHSLHNEVVFQFNPDFNLAPNQTLWLYFGDGQSKQIIDGETVLHSYPVNAGSGNVTYSLHLLLKEPNQVDNVSNNEDLVLKITTSLGGLGYTPPDEIWDISTFLTYPAPVQGAFPPGSPYNGNAVGGASAYIKYAPAHNGKLIKPLIFVDGIDFSSKTYTYNGSTVRHGTTGWDIFMLGNDGSEPNPYDNEPSEFSYYPSALNTFLSSPNDYDVIFLDFENGTDWIQKNGLVLVELIKRINIRKASDASTGAVVCDNAIIGASMGGLVAKWALSYMEENNISHQCHTYVSFDSPHRGAHIPLGIQSFIFQLNQLGQDEDNLWERLNAPAARQILLYNLGAASERGEIGLDNEQIDACNHILDSHDPVEFGFDKSAEMRSNFAGQMASLGYPQTTRNVAISCGSRAGNKLPFDDGADYFFSKLKIDRCLHGNVYWAEMAAIGGKSMFVEDWMYFCSDGGLGFGCTKHDLPTTPDCLYMGLMPNGYTCIFGNEVPAYFNKFTVTDNGLLPSLDNAPGCRRGDLLTIHDLLVKNKPSSSDVELTVNEAGYTSFMPTLSLLDIQWPMDNEHLVREFDPNLIVATGLTPFQAVYAPDINLRHIELTAAMVNFTLAQLAIGRAEAESGTLNLSSGQRYNYGYRKNRVPDAIINGGARLAVNITGTTNYMTPQDPLANMAHFEVFTGGGCDPGKTITVKSGGTLQIGDPSSAKTGYLHALPLAVVHIESGGTLRVSKASGLRIYKGATLILDPGAIVDLESAGSNILIEGDLVVNGDIVFKGLGYFDFSAGNKLVFGPGYNTFNLNGAGKDQRFVRLSSYLDIDAGHRLNWSRGLVEVSNSINLSTSAGLDFTEMTLHGMGAATAIDASHAGAITLDHCKVEYLDAAIIGDGLYGCTISNSDFSHYNDRQLNWQNALGVTVRNSNFDGAGATHALWCENVVLVNLSGSSFSGHGTPLPGNYTESDLLSAQAAVQLFEVTACLVAACNFSNNSVGIGAADDTRPANIYVYHSSSFIDHDAAIAVFGDQTRGAVLSDCSLFSGNKSSIRGRDISLMIDSWNSKIFSIDTDTPNRFLRKSFGAGSESHVRICYDLKGVGGSNMMRNNFWGFESSAAADPNPLPLLFLQNPTCSANISVPAIAPVSSIRIPTCGVPHDPHDDELKQPGSDCTLATGMTPNSPTVDEQFHLGSYMMRYDNFDAAIEVLRPVAALWQPEMGTYSSNCQQYIKVSKAFIDANDASNLPRSGAAPKQAQASGSLLITPNPANSVAIMHLTDEEHQLNVWNAQGRLVLKTSATGNS